MYVCFKQDLKRNVSYVGNTDTMAIGYVRESLISLIQLMKDL